MCAKTSKEIQCRQDYFFLHMLNSMYNLVCDENPKAIETTILTTTIEDE